MMRNLLLIGLSTGALGIILLGNYFNWAVVNYKNKVDRIWYLIISAFSYGCLYIAFWGPNAILNDALVVSHIERLIAGISIGFVGIMLLFISSMRRMESLSGFKWWGFPLVFFGAIIPNPLSDYMIFIVQSLSLILVVRSSDLDR